MAINIDRSNMDQFYRYKMPRLLAKVKDASWMQSPFVSEKTSQHLKRNLKEICYNF